MRSEVTGKNESWPRLVWPTLYVDPVSLVHPVFTCDTCAAIAFLRVKYVVIQVLLYVKRSWLTKKYNSTNFRKITCKWSWQLIAEINY